MKKYLYIKFILAIILLGLLGFSAISLAGGKLVQKHVETVYSEELYREASHIAQDPLIRSYRTIDNRQLFTRTFAPCLLIKIPPFG